MKFIAVLFLSLLSCTVACAQMKKLNAKQNKILLQSVKASNSNKHNFAIQQIEDLADKGVNGNSSYHFFANAVYYNYFSYSIQTNHTEALPALDKSLYHLGLCDSIENAYKMNNYTADNRIRLEQTLSLIDSYTQTLYRNNDFSSMDKLSAVVRNNSSTLQNKSPQADETLYKICDLILKAAIQHKSNSSILYLAEFLGSKKNISKEDRMYLCQVYQSSRDDKSALFTALQGIAEFPSDHQFVDITIQLFRNTKDGNLYDALLKESASSENDMIRQLASGCSFYHQQQYNEAFESFKSLSSTYPESSELCSLMAASCLKSALMSELSGKREDAKIHDALSLYLKVREMNPQDKSEWVNGLYTIYYRLKMDTQLKEVETLM